MCRCAVNAESMQSKKYRIIKARKSLNIAIIGGGIGGMEVARVASLRGHKVTIFEKTNDLGGVFIAASSFDFKEKDKALLNWYKLQMQKLNVKIKYNYDVTNLDEIRADKIIIATGAKPKILKIKGDKNNIINAVDYLNNKEKVGQNIIIVGGSLTGCEIAYKLFNEGKNPIIIEMKNDLMAVRGVCLANSSYLRDFFKLNKVPVYLNSSIKEINSDKITIKTKNEAETVLKFDNIISCIGYNPNPLSKKYDLVGDCYKVGNLKDVIWRAWDIAMKL